ncbi:MULTISPECIES: hypothetical protein [unclassified Undibacterium]|uniref:hypothetical protein n=1 Tax=unclassified Undibacterium TaxID=2630295 RepID=UPI002AC908AE|nr:MULTISPECIES: hypothetical protein [unclassified Undibacterium]MEB0139068.1 hypothetical protein [Undibacterium sp. CCC2.1]MEB0172975.1 hypothetical protein [Undibacterium sp. CCC1.1]MEB0177297.1 hypothetical protein [Undibacterium sp. CCC3.4]MEB0215893.1 hypothetical protein [Undibacterium sp. 5I2]WPX42094.1 hypothetical protein RHM61_11815 [Undibacterium sp. CCC3.4]
MRQSMTIRLDKEILEGARVFAAKDKRTLTNYIEALIRKDIQANQKYAEQEITCLNNNLPITVFIAEPLTERMIIDADEDDTPEEIAQRQRNIDILTGWNGS